MLHYAAVASAHYFVRKQSHWRIARRHRERICSSSRRHEAISQL